MSENKKTFKEFLNSILTPDQKTSIKKAFADIPLAAEPVGPAAPTSNTATLVDGVTIIKYDTPTLAVGTVVMVTTPDGSELPAPAGDLELQDGTKFTVDATGTITAITPLAAGPVEPAAPIEPAPVMQSQDASAKLVDALKELMVGKFEASNKEIESLKNIVSEQSKALESFKTFFTELIETPTAAPIKTAEFKTKKSKALSYIN